jgi:hypothetical protein
MILSCFRCRDDTKGGARFQDETHGKGMRVHNKTDKRIGTKPIYRCTICENERTAG